MMTPQQQVLYRADLFRKASTFQIPKRTPHFNSAVTWKIIDAGYKFSEAFHDYDVMEKCVRRFVETYPVDLLLDNGARNPFLVIESFGKGYYYYNDDECVVGVHPFELATSEDLIEYAKDPLRYTWEKTLPKKFPDWEEKGIADFQRAMDEQIKFNNYMAKISDICLNEYGIPNASSPAIGYVSLAIENMFTSVRGIKGLSIDMRRNMPRVKEAVDIMDQTGIYKTIDKIDKLPSGFDINTCFDMSLIMLAHTVLNPKQFEMLYFTPLNKLISKCQEKEKTLRLTVEGSASHILDYFKDVPKGVLLMLLEQDDIFDMRKNLPNIALIGGMPTTTLNNATVQECLDLTKKLIDELTPGYIFAENKFISYKNDAKAENLKAVCDFVATYENKI